MSGCATVAADESSVIAGSRPPSGPAAVGAGLAFGVFGLSSVSNLWTGKPFEKRELAEMFANAGGFGEPQVLSGTGCAACDVVAVVKCSEDAGSGPAKVAVFSARSKRELFSSQKNGGGCESLVPALGREVAAAFRPGTALYARVEEERGPKPAPSPEPAASPAAAQWWEKGR